MRDGTLRLANLDDGAQLLDLWSHLFAESDAESDMETDGPTSGGAE
ncbi:MAG: hypothetical protein ACTHNS_13030 [Marmoricola sp.]